MKVASIQCKHASSAKRTCKDVANKGLFLALLCITPTKRPNLAGLPFFDKQPDNKGACRCLASISLRQALELSPNDAPTFQPSQLLSCMATRQTRVICPVTPWSSCDIIVEKVASIEGQHASTAKRTCLQSCKDKKLWQTNACSWPCFLCRCIASKWLRLALELSPKNLAQGL